MQQINYLMEQLKLTKHARFGKQSEQTESLQGDLFDGALDDETHPEEVVETEIVSYERAKTKKKGRKLDTSKLPKETIVYDLSEDEKKM